MLTMRRRGAVQNFYIRGSVRLGAKSVRIAEYSTGTCDEAAAAYLKAELEIALRDELMFGSRAVMARAVLADAFEAYLTKPIKPNSSDVLRVGVMNDRIGQMSLSDPLGAWHRFRDQHLLDHAPSGQDRYRSLLQACINVFHERRGMPPIRLKSIPFNNQRIRFLSHAERDLLIGSYPDHARAIATVFAYQGARTQEVLQLRWGAAGVDIARGTMHFGRTKSGNPRTIEMHPRVASLLAADWDLRGRPADGHVFLNRLGRPYQDTRDLGVQGGNPLSSAHRGACKRAGIVDFRVHDWRHHWASHCVMAGIDLPTLMRLGGWKSLRMVQRYAAVDTTHMKAAIHKLV